MAIGKKGGSSQNGPLDQDWIVKRRMEVALAIRRLFPTIGIGSQASLLSTRTEVTSVELLGGC